MGGLWSGEVSFKGKSDGEVDTAHQESATEGENVGVHQGPCIMTVVVTDITKQESEDTIDKGKDVSHNKNHEKPVKPCLILCPEQEADSKTVDANTDNCH